MNNDNQKTYWKSTATTCNALPVVDPGNVRDRGPDGSGSDGSGSDGSGSDTCGSDTCGPDGISRRRFLEAAGFTVSLATVAGCHRAEERYALPFDIQPEGVVPGRRRSYASTCAGCSAACGTLVSVLDGRPLKMEGMPQHPFSQGGLCAVGQALPLELYDSQRLRHPLRIAKNADATPEKTNWNEVDQEILQQLTDVKAHGGAIRLVTSTVTSPSLQASIDAFLQPFDDAQQVTLDAASCSAILDAHQRTHALRALPHYQLDRARVIVSFGADFLGTWVSPVEFTAAWRSRRIPTPEHPEMSYHFQLEGRMSLTGSNADRRFRLAPQQYGIVLSHLAAYLSQRAGQSPPNGTLEAWPPSPDNHSPEDNGHSPEDNGHSPDNQGAADSDAPALGAAELKELADRLWNARGESLLLCDSQEVAVQALVNFINETLGNYGKTLDLQFPSRQRQGSDQDVLQLISDLKAGEVSVLMVAGTDLTHNLPALAGAIDKVQLAVSFSQRMDDFASRAHFVCPDHHPLESWLDAEPIRGIVSLSQPMLQPLGDTRSLIESLARWSGRVEVPAASDKSDRPEYNLIRETWNEKILPLAPQQPFQRFWDQAVHDGFVTLETEPAAVGPFQADAVQLLAAPVTDDDSPLSLILYWKTGLTDSRHAHNPWLQELPDSITKVTWDNYVSVSTRLAKREGLVDGDVVRVVTGGGQHLDLPALIQPGQHDDCLAIALGYGVRGTDRFAKIGPQWLEARPTVANGQLVGKNAARLIDASDGQLHYTRADVTLTKTGEHRDLASTQEHHSMEVPAHVAPHGAEVREPIQETTLAAFVKNPKSGAPHHHHFADEQLWAEDHPRTGHAWGMVVDLNACTGCSACLIACQAENNVPVVGKDEVRRQREMHWIRIDRYYSGNGDDVDVSHQPMMCQHCGNAPCETVCPVLATVHGEEGLNEQAYNRCVGTRYCANNCPYKVRRFNWFKYHHDDELQNLVLNPDVTVRSRGVMEKCSMCVQRIEDGKMEAGRLGHDLADGTIQTACQQSCPAQAIIFGDMNDPESRVHAALEDPRRYGVLEEFNFRPAVAYQRVVRNRVADDVEGDEHVAH